MENYEVSFNAHEFHEIHDELLLEKKIIEKFALKNKHSKTVLKDYYSQKNKLEIIKKSIDARHKPDIKIIYKFVFIRVNEFKKHIDDVNSILSLNCSVSNNKRPLIIGMGPCGLFAALVLAHNGYKPIIIERGSCVEERIQDIKAIRSNGKINSNSNIQFGEGGAGTFSDGKLYSGVTSEYKEFILRKFVENGAPSDIVYDSNPHIGTDILQSVIVNLRREIEAYGGEVHFNSLLKDITINDGCISEAVIENLKTSITEAIRTDCIILAIGHSSRDTLRMLNKHNIVLQNKPFAVGVRIEHLRKNIDISQYGFDTFDYDLLSAANYKLAVDTKTGKKLYTFCMCPGGEVVASQSDSESVCTNGMSYRARNLINSNSALLVPVDEDDYGHDILDGVKFQEELEHKAYIAGGSNGSAPVMTYKALKDSTDNFEFGEVIPSFLPGTSKSNFKTLFNDIIYETLVDGIDKMGNKIKGFNNDDAVLTAVEARSSSPIRILRDPETRESTSVKGLYPAGEGAGYAGGIMSSAIDGIKTALKIINTEAE
ncbi:MAG: hypothetical protein MJ153_04695 [Clostridia bacterium]|nr:hypothetical protein [Clostridia bacterium]